MFDQKKASVAAALFQSVSRTRPQREQEAEIFERAADALQQARQGRLVEQVRALADNRRIWVTVIDLMRNPENALPPPLRADIISLSIAVQRDMDSEEPDFDFLIAVNQNMAAGLQGR
jgi:flagellar biosynthesis activator protein FlaF